MDNIHYCIIDKLSILTPDLKACCTVICNMELLHLYLGRVSCLIYIQRGLYPIIEPWTLS